MVLDCPIIWNNIFILPLGVEIMKEYTKEEQEKLDLMRKYIGPVPFSFDLMSKRYPDIAKRVYQNRNK